MRDEIEEGRTLLARQMGELAQIHQSQQDVERRDAEWEERQRLIGRISFYLDTVPLSSGVTSDEERRFREESARVASLEQEVASDDWIDRRDTALAAIGLHMRTLAHQLELENAEAALRLDIGRLTVVRDSPSGRPEHLNEIGGGENWVGYHLSALLSLHMFFIEHSRPVPSILVLDQPSQIYFPVQGESEASKSLSGTDRTDWIAVRRVYELIFKTVRDLQSRLQVIVMDHADLSGDWEEFASAVRVRWRDNQKFI